jgi:hypothetical protein
MPINYFVPGDGGKVKGFPVTVIVGCHSVNKAIFHCENFLTNNSIGFNIQTHMEMVIPVFTKIGRV